MAKNKTPSNSNNQDNNTDTASVDLSKPGQGNAPEKKEEYQEPARSQDGNSLEEPNQSHKFILSILGVFLVAVLLGSGWYFYSIQEEDTEDIVTEEESVEEEPFTLVVTVESFDTEETVPIITGTVNDSDAEVLVTVGENEYVAVVDEDGNWSVTVSEELPSGTYDVTVVANSEDTDQSEQASGQVTILELEPELEPEPEPEPEPEEEESPDELPATGGSGNIPVY